MSNRNVKVLKMSEESLAKINAENIQQLYDELRHEFERRAFLRSRYDREDELDRYFDADEELRKDLSSIVPIERSSIDTATGYIIGKPVTYYSRKTTKIDEVFDLFGNKRVIVREQDSDEMLNDLQAVLKANNEAKQNIDLVQDTLICRTAYELVYLNEKGEIEFAKGNPLTDTAIYNLDIKPKLIGYIRSYSYTDYLDNNTTTTIYELRTKKRWVKFELRNGAFTTSGMFKNANGEMSEDVPDYYPFGVIEYPMPERIGFVEQQLPEIMEYEKSKTDIKSLLKYNQEMAKLILSGWDLPEEASEQERTNTVTGILKNPVLFVGDNPDGVNSVKWLTKQIDDAVFQHKKSDEKGDVYGTLGMVNPTESDTVYQNYLALRYKMYGIDQKAAEIWAIYKEGLLKRAGIIIQFLNSIKKTNYDASVIDCNFTANIPVDKATEMAMFGQLSPYVSKETIYSMASFIENPMEEIKKFRAQQIEDAKTEAAILKITSDATQEDINPRTEEDHLTGEDVNADGTESL